MAAPLGNPRQIPQTTSDLGRIIVIDMRLRLTLVMRSVVGLPQRANALPLNSS